MPTDLHSQLQSAGSGDAGAHGASTRASELLDVARAAVEYSCAPAIRRSLVLRRGAHYHWIDSFHTGYNLDSLKSYIESTGDQTFRPHLDRGFRYFKTHFFEPDGTAEVLPRPHVPDRYSVRGTGDRDLGEFLRT